MMDTKFYCSRCVREVGFNTERCPYCGETFNAVKCPICGFIGHPSKFSRGCPSCGFIGNFNNVKREKGNRAWNSKKKKAPLIKINISPLGYQIILVLFIVILVVLLILVFRLQ